MADAIPIPKRLCISGVVGSALSFGHVFSGDAFILRPLRFRSWSLLAPRIVARDTSLHLRNFSVFAKRALVDSVQRVYLRLADSQLHTSVYQKLVNPRGDSKSHLSSLWRAGEFLAFEDVGKAQTYL